MKQLHLLGFLCLLLVSNLTLASHQLVANISYKYISTTEIEVELKTIHECGGLPIGQTQIYSAEICGTTSTQTATLSSANLIPIFLDSVSLAIGTCNGGYYYEYQILTYKDTLTVSSTCNTFNVKYGMPGVPTSNYSLSSGFTVSAHQTAAGNLYSTKSSGPEVHTLNGGNMGNLFINSGIYDLDGDSLHFELVVAKDASGNDLTLNTGYSSSNPAPHVSINSETGQLMVNADSVNGIILVAVETSQYGVYGNLKGKTLQYQLVVNALSYSSNDLNPEYTAVSNVSGASFNSGKFTCAPGNNNICFDILFADGNASDTIDLVTNITDALPGATYSFSGTNPITLSVCWNYAAMTGKYYHFSTTAYDNSSLDSLLNMPTGNEWMIYFDNITPEIIPDSVVLCNGDTAHLEALATDSVIWTVLSGEAFNSSNFSCTTCPNVDASPSTTTLYQAQMLKNGSTFLDTVAVVVTQPSSPTNLQNMYSICPGDTLFLHMNPALTAYQWNITAGDVLNTSNFGCTSCDSTWYIPNASATYIKYIIDANTVCEQSDSTVVSTHQVAADIYANNSYQLCENEPLQLSSNVNGSAVWASVSGAAIDSSSLGCNTCVNTTIVLDQSAIWAIELTDTNQCVVHDTLTLNVQNLQPDLGLNNQEQLCKLSSITLNSTANATIQWMSISGEALVAGNNISCLNCASPTISIQQTSELVVSNTYFGTCQELDTVMVMVNDSGLVSGTITISVNGASPTPMVNSNVDLSYWDGTNWMVYNTVTTNNNGDFADYTTHDSVTITVHPNSSYGQLPAQWYDGGTGTGVVQGMALDYCNTVDLSMGVTSTSNSVQSVHATQWNLHPNPSNGLFTINSAEKGVISVWSITGQKVHESVIQMGKNSIEISVPSGTYLVRFTYNNQTEVQRLVIK